MPQPPTPNHKPKATRPYALVRCGVVVRDDPKQGTWTTAEGGDLKLTLALAGDKRFMRLALG